jgi:hypothetical protein
MALTFFLFPCHPPLLSLALKKQQHTLFLTFDNFQASLQASLLSDAAYIRQLEAEVCSLQECRTSLVRALGELRASRLIEDRLAARVEELGHVLVKANGQIRGLTDANTVFDLMKR